MLVVLGAILASGIAWPSTDAPAKVANVVDQQQSPDGFASDEQLEDEVTRLERDVQRCLKSLTIEEIRQLPQTAQVQLRRLDDDPKAEAPADQSGSC